MQDLTLFPHDLEWFSTRLRPIIGARPAKIKHLACSKLWNPLGSF